MKKCKYCKKLIEPGEQSYYVLPCSKRHRPKIQCSSCHKKDQELIEEARTRYVVKNTLYCLMPGYPVEFLKELAEKIKNSQNYIALQDNL